MSRCTILYPVEVTAQDGAMVLHPGSSLDVSSATRTSYGTWKIRANWTVSLCGLTTSTDVAFEAEDWEVAVA